MVGTTAENAENEYHVQVYAMAIIGTSSRGFSTIAWAWRGTMH